MKPTLCIPGDCDNDDQCAGDLVCGKDNCFTDFGWPKDLLNDAGNYTSSHDCCAKVSKATAVYVNGGKITHLMI